MKVWVMQGIHEGELFSSVHLTEKGAALAAIADVLDFLGVTDEAEIDESKVEQRVKRVGEPTVKLHSLGAVACFTSKKKALQFIEDYFREHQDHSPESLELSEIKNNS